MAKPGIASRGVLLDIAKLRGVDILPGDYAIKPALTLSSIVNPLRVAQIVVETSPRFGSIDTNGDERFSVNPGDLFGFDA